MLSPVARRRLRTLILGVVACGALFWGAIDLVGVPPANLYRLLGQVVVGIALVVALAVLPAALMIWWRARRRH
jgi:hypothetical protein